MKNLEQRICHQGVVCPGGILQVDRFLNHQIDVALLDELGAELCRRFAGAGINKVVTVESSGIAVACAVARQLRVPVVFARKKRNIPWTAPVYQANVESSTGSTSNRIAIAKELLGPEDHVLIVDDILANGYTLQGLISMVESAEATVEGLGIVIEKAFQEGGSRLRNLGYRLESLAIVESADEDTGAITFRSEKDN